MKKSMAVLWSVLVLPTMTIAQDEIYARTGIKAGVEFAGYLSSQRQIVSLKPQ